MVDDEEITQRVFMRPRRLLSLLEPQWIDDGTRSHTVAGSRFGMGVSLICPGHPTEGHRIELYFLNPIDGDAPKPMPILYYRTGHSFADLTLSTDGHAHDEIISVEEHWEGYIHHGEVIDALQVR